MQDLFFLHNVVASCWQSFISKLILIRCLWYVITVRKSRHILHVHNALSLSPPMKYTTEFWWNMGLIVEPLPGALAVNLNSALIATSPQFLYVQGFIAQSACNMPKGALLYLTPSQRKKKISSQNVQATNLCWLVVLTVTWQSSKA